MFLLGLLGCNETSAAPDGGPNAPIPPRPADAGGVSRGAVRTFAIDSIFLGDTDRALGPAASPWRDYGYDLDGVATGAASVNVCTLVDGAAPSNQVDGNGGRDNAWGAILMPVIESNAADGNASAAASYEIAHGAWTLELELDGFSRAKNVIGIGAKVFTGATLPGPASFGQGAHWPVLASSVVDGAAIGSGARVEFDDGYVTPEGLFVSGAPSDVPLVLPLYLIPTYPPLVLTVHRAVITFSLDPSDESQLINGTLAGLLYADELTSAARTLADASKALCGTFFDWTAASIHQSQDILRDGTNAPGVPCDAISFGVGFTARLIGNPTSVVPDPAPLPNLCDSIDGGTTDDGTGD